MANNIDILDGLGGATKVKSTDNAGVHTPHHNIDVIAAGDNNIGNVDIASIAAGDNNIGNVDVVTLPALAAGTNNIGDVDVLTVPADPFGANADSASATGSISAKLRFIASTGIPITGTVTVGSHAVTNAGTFVTQENGAALTALQLIDNIIGTEDAAAPSAVALIGGRYDSSPRTLETGDIGAFALNASGQLLVEIAAGAGSGGTSMQDGAAFTGGSSSINPIGGVYQATPDTITDGDVAGILIDASRRVVIAPSEADATHGAVDGVNVFLHDSSGNQIDSFGAGTQYTEDAAAASDPVGTALMLVRRDTPSASEVTANGDNVAAKAASTGAMYVEILGGTTKLGDSTNGLLVNLGANNDVTVTGTVTVGSHAVTNAGTFATQVDGAALTALQLIDNSQVAHGSASAGIGVNMIGLQARSTDVTAEASGDAVWAQATLVGKQVVLPYSISQVTWQYASPSAVTDTADDAAKTAAGSGIRNYVTAAQVFCNHATTGTVVVIKTASTVIHQGYAAPLGGGFTCTFPTPLKGGDNEAINVANITNSSSTYFNLQGYTSVEA